MVRPDLINSIVVGDCRDSFSLLEDHSVDLIITSPPYFRQREYEAGGIGNEMQVGEYCETLLDIFAQGPELLETIRRLRGSEFIVYGVTIDYCVRLTAFGLLDATGCPVTLVTDATRGIRQEDADATLRELVARGGRLVACDEVCR